MYYLRVEEDRKISFVVDGIHQILSTDIKITTDSYNKFFEEQEKGICFRAKSERENTKLKIENNLLDFVESFEMEAIADETQTEVERLREEVEEMKLMIAELKSKHS